MTLRSDNADLRLTAKGCFLPFLHTIAENVPLAREAGAISDRRWNQFEKIRLTIQETTQLLQSVNLSPQVCFISVVLFMRPMFALGMDY